MLRPLFVVLLLIGSAASAYAGWACHRASDTVLLREGWSRPWPWPDVWLFALHEWFDARYPVWPGGIKLAGEIARVQSAVRIALLMCITLTVSAALPLWILDEPFAALDAAAVELVRSLAGQHLAGGGMVVVTSHQDVRIPGASQAAINLG